MKMQDKKGQIGGTITWFVATIIIIATLLIFIYASSLIGEARKSVDFGDVSNSGEKYRSSMYSSLKTEVDNRIFYDILEKEGITEENRIQLNDTVGSSYDFSVRYEIVDLRDAKIIGTGTGKIISKIKLSENLELRVFDSSI